MSELAEFRSDVRGWLAENCPEGAKGPGQIANGSSKIELEPDVALWLERCAEKVSLLPHGQLNLAAADSALRKQKFSMKKWAMSVPACHWVVWV